MKKLRLFGETALFVPLLLCAGLLAAFPQSAAAQQEDADPPARVARISYMQGSVSYQVSGDQNWVQADPNRPLTTGDNLWADQSSRAEFHIGSTAVRMADQTGISILTLDDRTVQLQLAQGTIEVHLRQHNSEDAFEIDTPNISLTLATGGEYTISTDPNGSSTDVIVREGQMTGTGAGDSYTLGPEQEYRFTGTDELTYDAEPAPDFSPFEDWAQERDQIENNSISAHYVSRDVDGVYDLDTYGTWDSAPDYGEVWVPNGVPAGWAPYRYGHWVWVAPWGWTWVEAEPWGFAPFHYGRWVAWGGRWAWVPGPVVVRPVYCPAVVGFVGGGAFSFSVSFGPGVAGVAWFPLGPRDVWMPAYHASPRYVQYVNITNTRVVNVTQVTNVYNVYRTNVNVTNVNVTRVNNIRYTYENEPRAITAVSRETFVSAQPVHTAMLRVAPQQIRSVQVVEHGPIQPTERSFVASQAKPAQARPSVPFEQRPVVARLTPAAPADRRTPVYTNDSHPFNQPEQARQPQQPAQPVRPGEINRAEPPQPARPNQPPSQPAERGGFRPFTPPGGQAEQPPRRPEEAQPQPRPQPPVRYAPPVRANDRMYDVHPPLNQRPQSQPKPQRQESRPSPPPRSESHGGGSGGGGGAKGHSHN